MNIKEYNDVITKEKAYCSVIRETIRVNEKECADRLAVLYR